MKGSLMSWMRRGASYVGGSAALPLLAVYLYVAPCSGGQTGVVFAFKGWGVSVAGGYCHA
jgi:hypothetical protein